MVWNHGGVGLTLHVKITRYNIDRGRVSPIEIEKSSDWFLKRYFCLCCFKVQKSYRDWILCQLSVAEKTSNNNIYKILLNPK